jgi:hypothetical protein
MSSARNCVRTLTRVARCSRRSRRACTPNQNHRRRPTSGLRMCSAFTRRARSLGGAATRIPSTRASSASIRFWRDSRTQTGCPGAEYRLPVAAVENPVLTVVPGFVAYPPELSYPPTRQTTEPAVALRERGRSRTAYFPGNIEHSFWIGGNTDLSHLLQNTIRWVAGDGAPVRIEGDGLIEAFAWETDPGFAVHVLNYTNPNTHRGWLREFYPIGEQRVRLAVARRDERCSGLRCCGRRRRFRSGRAAMLWSLRSRRWRTTRLRL